MKQSLEQTLIVSAHQAIDDTARLIPERGLPFNVDITFRWLGGTFVSQSISVRDGSLETDETTDEDVEPELTEDRVREIVQRTIEAEFYKHTSGPIGYYFNSNNKLMTFGDVWGLISTAEQRLNNRIAQLEQPHTPWQERLANWWQGLWR